MRKRQKEAILISFFQEKEKYERLAEYIVHLVNDDPSSPTDNLHNINYRIKNEVRLIEKIDEENKKNGPDSEQVTHKNYQKKVGDLLGIRLICLRLSDIKKIEAYLELLSEEKMLRFLEKPALKRSFVLPIDPGEAIPEGLDLGFSGYSSIHYQIIMGDNSGVPDDLKGLQVELQLRTILEEAWGEIDHKFRYTLNRSGVELPEHIHTGFYNLSAYLQAAALQAEHLCRQAEMCTQARNKKSKAKSAVAEGPEQAKLLPGLLDELEKAFGFKPTVRTVTYILKRLNEFGYSEHPDTVFHKIFTKGRLTEFGAIFREVLKREAFTRKNKRNVDAINAVNFTLSFDAQGKRVAQEGLRSVLGWRKERN